MKTTSLSVVLTALLAAGCSSDPEPAADAGTGDGGAEADAGAEVGIHTINRKLDVLFVIDNSGSMLEEQVALTSAFAGIETGLTSLSGGRPDLHIGIVSTDMGANDGVIPCGAAGDDGALQTAAQLPNCTPPGGDFISDVATASGRSTNYSGSLADTFACISPLGTNGCGFESPLAALRRALDPAVNPGFVRDDAALAVVLLTDEDDCSTTDRSMFNDLNASVDDPLGPFNSFRCFDFGVVCDPDQPRTEGAKTSCISREDSAYMTPISEFVTFIEDLKGPGRFAVSAVTGVPESSSGGGSNASVTPDSLSGEPMLDPVCVSGAGVAAPAIRISEFVRAFPTGSVSSICNATYNFSALVASVDQTLTHVCTEDASETCEAMRTSPSGTSAPVSECTGPSDEGCFEVLRSTALCNGAAFRYRSASDEAEGTTVTFDCR